nr:TonB-dependent hemoglobin/transferrin/lactoferrin family receptor [Variovorax dokdonensis]
MPEFRLRLLAGLIGSVFATGAVAQESVRTAALDTIVVSGSRSEQKRDDVPASMEVLDRETMEAEQVNDIRDAVRDMPNVSVKRAPARFGLAAGNTGRDGNAGFNIRGLDGNRVLLLTDGIRTPRSYVFSANAFGRDYFDIGLIERIEVLKGPASALYGSDGMAGLVNLITREPQSFLQGDTTFGGSASVGYSGEDDGWHTGLSLAGKASDTVQWLLSASGSKTEGLKNMGTNDSANSDRTTPNPQDDTNRALLAKVILTPTADQRHALTYEHIDKTSDYDMLSGRSKPPYTSTSVIDLQSETTMKRDRFTYDGRIKVDSAMADSIQAVLSYQKAGSNEYAYENRYTAADRVRDVDYDEDTWQAILQANKVVRVSPDWAHSLTYGFDFTRTDVTNLQTGLVPPAGETYPLKRFPDTRETSSAFYIQDEIIHDRWSITPGLRFDQYDIDADQTGFNATAASTSGSAVSPKLGVLFRATPSYSLYGNYATGFKAPNAFQVNNFFENVQAGYKTIPNPDLKPEKSQNFEIGVRGRTGIVNFDVAAFTGNYKDLIEENRLVGGRGIPRIDPLVFQSVNIGEARISGFEFKGDVDFTEQGRGFSVPFAYGHTEGTNKTDDRPLNSVDPDKGSVGLKYNAGAWSARLDVVYYAGKKRGDVDPSEVTTGQQFLPPSATTLDISAQWRINPRLRLNVGIVNVTDKKYWRWSDVRGLASNSTVLDAYSQPGRTFNATLVADF